VQGVVARLAEWWPGAEVSTLPGIVEDVQFKLPAALAEDRSASAAA
jgi:4-hydroxy-3-methylbut-2-en-1-yl diphosphate reductase